MGWKSRVIYVNGNMGGIYCGQIDSGFGVENFVESYGKG